MLPIKKLVNDLIESKDLELNRKFILVTQDFSGLGFVIDEINKNGSECLIAYKPKDDLEGDELDAFYTNGDGLVDKIDLDYFMANRNDYKDWYIVFDMNCLPDENDILREEGFKVFGGHSEANKMENEREYTLELAESYGLHSPEHYQFNSVEDGVSFLEDNEDKCYVFKANGSDDCSLTRVPAPGLEPNNANIEMRSTIEALGIDDYILQEKVDGIEVNVEYFVVNGIPVLAQANLEDKRLINGDLGPNTGCMMDVCWEIPMDSKLAQMTAAKWLPYAKELNFTGFVDANCIIGKDNVYFLETCWRCGYNAHPNFFSTLSKKTFLQTAADMLDGVEKYDLYTGFGASITVRLDKSKAGFPIYFPKSLEPNIYFFDVKLENDLYMTNGFAKEIAIITAHDWTVQKAFEKCLLNAEKFRLDDKIQRTDADKTDFPQSPIKRYEALLAMGIL